MLSLVIKSDREKELISYMFLIGNVIEVLNNESKRKDNSFVV